jgi:hypothetical protein
MIDIKFGTHDGPIVGKLTLNTETGYYVAVMNLANSGMKDVAKDVAGYLALEGLYGYERVVEFETVNNGGHVQFEGYVIPGEYTGALCRIEGM